MKKLALILLLLAVPAYLAWQSPAVGHWVYGHASDWEAQFHGFEQAAVDIGGLEMALYQGGPADKPAIIMVHGFSADKDVWPRFATHLLSDYRIIIPDLAGHGDTAFDPSWDYSGPAQAKRIVKLMDAMNIQQAHVIGNSMGGFVTAWFARLYPERTLSATPMNPYGVAAPELTQLDHDRKAGRHSFFIDNREQFDHFYGLTMAKPPYLPEFVLAAFAENYIAKKEQLKMIADGFEQKNLLLEELPHIKKPVWLVWGKEDAILHVSAAERWAKALPNKQLLLIDDIGHMPMVEMPEALAEQYRQFLLWANDQNL